MLRVWPVPLNGTLGNASSGAVFCQVSIQIKRARGQMAWSGACLGAGMAPSFTPLASCAHRVRQSTRTWHLFVPLALGLEGDFGQVDLTCEEPPGDRAPWGAAWSPRF